MNNDDLENADDRRANKLLKAQTSARRVCPFPCYWYRDYMKSLNLFYIPILRR